MRQSKQRKQFLWNAWGYEIELVPKREKELVSRRKEKGFLSFNGAVAAVAVISYLVRGANKLHGVDGLGADVTFLLGVLSIRQGR